MLDYLKVSKIRILGLILVATVILPLVLAGCGAQKPKMYRVGVLSGLNYIAGITDGFKEGMAELGYVEGQNIIYDVQATDFDIPTYQRILQKFVADKVDLILVFPSEAALEAKTSTQGTNIPVIFNFALIEGIGLVDSVREPGGNITGVRYPGPDVALKRFEIMRELAPEAKRFLLPYQKGYPIVVPQLEVLHPAAEAAGITLIELPVDGAADLTTGLQALAQGDDPGVDAILGLVEPLTVTPDAVKVLLDFSYEHKVPVGGALASDGEHGTVFGVNVEIAASGRQAAPLADKILKGTPAGTLPVISAESFLQIDYKAAQALGIEVPESLLNQANEILR